MFFPCASISSTVGVVCWAKSALAFVGRFCCLLKEFDRFFKRLLEFVLRDDPLREPHRFCAFGAERTRGKDRLLKERDREFFDRNGKRSAGHNPRLTSVKAAWKFSDART